MAPSEKDIKKCINGVIEMEGFGLTVTTLRKVVGNELGVSYGGEGERKKFRKMVEDCIKDQLLMQPSLIETLKTPVVNAGVGKTRKSAGRASGTKRKSTSSKTTSTKKRPKKEKKEDSKNPQPKKPLSGFFWFGQLNREAYKSMEEHKTKDIREMASLLGAEWRGMEEDAPKRKEATERAEKDKERYLKEMEAWEKTEEGKEFLASKKKAPRASGGSSKPRAPRKKKTKTEDGLAGVVDEDATSSDVSESESESSSSDSSSNNSSGSSSSSTASSSS